MRLENHDIGCMCLDCHHTHAQTRQDIQMRIEPKHDGPESDPDKIMAAVAKARGIKSGIAIRQEMAMGLMGKLLAADPITHDMVPRTRVLELENAVKGLSEQLREAREETRNGWVKQHDHDQVVAELTRELQFARGEKFRFTTQREAFYRMEQDLSRVRNAIGEIKFNAILANEKDRLEMIEF